MRPLLSRTANNLYWLGRYMERAENLARILEVGDRMSMLPGDGDEGENNEWWAAVVISGCREQFVEAGVRADAFSVIEFLAYSPDNPSSLHSCIRFARDNGRSVRTALTAEMWESLNGAWIDFEPRWRRYRQDGQVRPFLDWMKERAAHFRGTMEGTMLRNEPYRFTRLGRFVERADNTARIADQKYHILLPQGSGVGGAVDYYQWTTILRAVSALRSYHYLYREAPVPWRIAELLLLRAEMPRSLVYCLGEIVRDLDHLAEAHGGRHECHRLAGKLYSQLRFAKADDIFQSGLHEFLTDFIARNNTLGDEIARSYMLPG